MKIKTPFLFFVFCLFALHSILAQNINLIRFNNSVNYTPGSGVSVIINPTDTFALNNQFVLELSDPGGTWGNPTVLTSLIEFYVPVINGTLPSSLVAGTYKLRVRSTNPAGMVETGGFTVVSGAAISSPHVSSTITTNANSFNCISCNGNYTMLGSLTQSATAKVSTLFPDSKRTLQVCDTTPGYQYRVKLYDILGNAVTSLVVEDGAFIIPPTLGIGTYVIEVEKYDATSSSVYSVVFLFHGNATSLGNKDSEIICVGESVAYSIDTSMNGIGRNYYGSRYEINFGDGTVLTLTQAQLLAQPTIDHIFRQVSCAFAGSAFTVQEDLFNKGITVGSCDTYVRNGNGVSKKVNTSKAPNARFLVNGSQCVNSDIFATNDTELGSFGSGGNCMDDAILYWYYKKPGSSIFRTADSLWIDSNGNLRIPASVVNIPGCWEIKLEAQNRDLCQTITAYVSTVGVDARPIPSFTVSQDSICPNTQIQFTNTSNVLNYDCQSARYQWTLTPGSGFSYADSTTSTSKDPRVIFTQPGIYQVTLSVTNSCGTVVSTPQKIVVYGTPVVSFSTATHAICTANPANFTIDFASMPYRPAYSTDANVIASYEWTVSGSGVTGSDYTYVGGTTSASAFPIIQFKAFKTYTVNVKVYGKCGGAIANASFDLILKEIPEITNTNLMQAICSGYSSTDLVLTSSMSGTTFSWTVDKSPSIITNVSSGSGTTIPGMILLNSSNTSTGTVTYHITPSNNGCDGTTRDFVINVNPAPSISNKTTAICSGNAFSVTPVNSGADVVPTGTTYTWTTPVGAPVGAITGGSEQASPQTSISQLITNLSGAPATMTYTVTPNSGSGGACVGAPFIVTVTVNPLPGATISGTTDVCQNASQPMVAFTGTNGIAPYTFTYKINNGEDLTVSTTTGNSIDVAVPTNMPGIFTYALVSVKDNSSTTCANPQTGSVVVTVNPLPKATISGSKEVCQNSAAPDVVFKGMGGTAPYTITYNVNGGADQAIITGAGDSATVSVPTLVVGVNTFNLISVKDASSTECVNPQSGTAIVKVNPLPTATISAPAAVCQSSASVVTFTGATGTAPYTFTYNINGGASQTVQTTSGNSVTVPVSTTSPGTFTYNLISVKDGSVSACDNVQSGAVIITVNSLPTATISGTISLCQGAASPLVTFTGANGTPPYDFTYQVNGGAPQTIHSTGNVATIAVPTSTAGVFNYTLISVTDSSTTTCTNNQSGSAVITIDPLPQIANKVAGLCGSGSFSVAPISGGSDIVPLETTYSWGIPVVTGGVTGGVAATGQTSVSGTLTNPTDQLQTATYIVTPASGSCVGDTFTVVVSLSPKPVIANMADTICNGGFSLIPVNRGGNIIPTGTTYTWTTPVSSPVGAITGGSAQATGVTSISQNLTNTISTAATLTYTVIPNSSGCVGDPFNVSVTVNPTPNVVPQATTICSGESLMLTPANGGGNIIPGGTTYSWDMPTVTGGVTGGASSSNQASIVTTLTNPTNEPQTATYKIAPVSGDVGNCPGDSFVYVVTVKPRPIVKDKATTVCSGSSFVISPVNGAEDLVPNGTTYTWSVSSASPAITGGSAQNVPQSTVSQLLTNTTNLPAEITYSVVPAADGCAGAAFTVKVTVNPTPKVPNQTQTICSGESFTLSPVDGSGNIIPKNTTYKWNAPVVTGGLTGGVSGNNASEISGTLMNPTNSLQTATYTITPVSGDSGYCEGVPFTLIVSVNPVSQISEQKTGLCGSGTFNLMPANTGTDIVPAATTYSWGAPVVTGGVTGGAAGTGQSSIGGTLNNPTDQLQTATYVVTPTSGSCVGDTFKVIVSLSPKPVIANMTDTICSGVFGVTPVNGGGNIIPAGTVYTWATPVSVPSGAITGGSAEVVGATSISQNITNVTGAQATLTYTVIPNSSGCVGNPFNVTITVNPTPKVVSQAATICSGESFSLTPVNGGGNIITPGTTYNWGAPVVTGGLTGGVAGSGQSGIAGTLTNPTNATQTAVYTITPISGMEGHCPGQPFTYTVTVHPVPYVADTIRTTIYSEDSFVIIPANGNGNIIPAGITYTWGNPVINPAGSITGASALLIPQTQISQTLTNNTYASATVTYSVSPVSGACAGNPFVVIVKVNPLLYPNATISNITCFGANNGAITTNVIGGVPFTSGDPYLLEWTGPNGFTSNQASISGLLPGSYHLTVTDAEGLTYDKDYLITEPTDIALTTTRRSDITCHGANDGMITISVSGGTGAYSYVWTKDGTPFSTNQSLAGLAAGIYEVSVTDANGCGPKTMTYIIAEPAVISVVNTGQTNILCHGDSTGVVQVSVSGGVLIEKTPGVFDYNYSWTGSGGFKSTNANLANIPAGTYDLTVTDANGCTATLSVIITEPEDIVITAATTPITCYQANNASITLDIKGGVSPYTAQWDNLASGTFQDNLAAGDYKIVVTDANGCRDSITVNIPEAPIFTIRPIVKNITCFGANNGSIVLNIIGGKAPISLKWDDSATAGNARYNLGAGAYTVTITDGTPCTIYRTFTILEPQELTLSANVTNALNCNVVNSGAIDLTVIGGTAPYVYSWSNTASTEDIANLPAGKYIVTVTDANGCTKTAEYEVKRPQPISIDVTREQVYDCANQILKMVSTARVSGGVPPYQMNWSSGVVSGANNEIMTTTVSAMVLLQVTDAMGCTAVYSYDVDIQSPGFNYQLLNCDAQEYRFTPVSPDVLGSNITYTWDFGDGSTSTQGSTTHKYASGGSYKVRLTISSSTCTNTFEKNIFVEKQPELILDREPAFCKGDSMVVHVSGTDFYKWENGSTADSMVVKAAGTYRVQGISKAGCTSTLEFNATYLDMFHYTISSDKDVINPDNADVKFWSQSIPSSLYYWEFGDSTAAQGNNLYHTYQVNKDGYFDVRLTVINPNGCTETAMKRIWVAPTFIPNVFTPDADGINDFFMSGWRVRIFNRNGVLFYDGSEGWDGTFKGKPVANDTYFYVLYYTTDTGTKTREGYITVIRK